MYKRQGVKNATYNGVAFLGWGPPPDEIIARTLNAVIKLDLIAPVVRNGVLEAMEGDTITAAYMQPDSSMILTRDWVLPAPPR